MPTSTPDLTPFRRLLDERPDLAPTKDGGRHVLCVGAGVNGFVPSIFHWGHPANKDRPCTGYAHCCCPDCLCNCIDFCPDTDAHAHLVAHLARVVAEAGLYVGQGVLGSYMVVHPFRSDRAGFTTYEEALIAAAREIKR